MTEAQAGQIIALLETLQFLAHAGAATLGMIWGAWTWSLIVKAKNERSFW